MRAFLAALIVLASGCGPGSPLVSNWRYMMDLPVQSATGVTTKMVTFDLELGASAAADLVVWKFGGGCNVPLGVVGKVATLGTEPPLCGFSGGAKVQLFEVTGQMVKADDQLAMKSARFEVLDDGRLSTSFDFKLHTDLKDARVGPQYTVVTTAATHGTRVR